MMNKEYLGLAVKKGSFVARNTKIGDFVIGKDAIEEIDACILEFMLPKALARTYEPNDLVSQALRKMRKYTLPKSK